MASSESEDLPLPIEFWSKREQSNAEKSDNFLVACKPSDSRQSSKVGTHFISDIAATENSGNSGDTGFAARRKRRKCRKLPIPIMYSDAEDSNDDEVYAVPKHKSPSKCLTKSVLSELNSAGMGSGDGGLLQSAEHRPLPKVPVMDLSSLDDMCPTKVARVIKKQRKRRKGPIAYSDSDNSDNEEAQIAQKQQFIQNLNVSGKSDRFHSAETPARFFHEKDDSQVKVIRKQQSSSTSNPDFVNRDKVESDADGGNHIKQLTIPPWMKRHKWSTVSPYGGGSKNAKVCKSSTPFKHHNLQVARVIVKQKKRRKGPIVYSDSESDSDIKVKNVPKHRLCHTGRNSEFPSQKYASFMQSFSENSPRIHVFESAARSRTLPSPTDRNSGFSPNKNASFVRNFDGTSQQIEAFESLENCVGFEKKNSLSPKVENAVPSHEIGSGDNSLDYMLEDSAQSASQNERLVVIKRRKKPKKGPIVFPESENSEDDLKDKMIHIHKRHSLKPTGIVSVQSMNVSLKQNDVGKGIGCDSTTFNRNSTNAAQRYSTETPDAVANFDQSREDFPKLGHENPVELSTCHEIKNNMKHMRRPISNSDAKYASSGVVAVAEEHNSCAQEGNCAVPLNEDISEAKDSTSEARLDSGIMKTVLETSACDNSPSKIGRASINLEFMSADNKRDQLSERLVLQPDCAELSITEVGKVSSVVHKDTAQVRGSSIVQPHTNSSVSVILKGSKFTGMTGVDEIVGDNAKLNPSSKISPSKGNVAKLDDRLKPSNASQEEQNIYTSDKLKISRSRFGAFRRRNYKFAPLIFGEENKNRRTYDTRKQKDLTMGRQTGKKLSDSHVLSEKATCPQSKSGVEDQSKLNGAKARASDAIDTATVMATNLRRSSRTKGFTPVLGTEACILSSKSEDDGSLQKSDEGELKSAAIMSSKAVIEDCVALRRSSRLKNQADGSSKSELDMVNADEGDPYKALIGSVTLGTPNSASNSVQNPRLDKHAGASKTPVNDLNVRCMNATKESLEHTPDCDRTNSSFERRSLRIATTSLLSSKSNKQVSDSETKLENPNPPCVKDSEETLDRSHCSYDTDNSSHEVRRSSRIASSQSRESSDSVCNFCSQHAIVKSESDASPLKRKILLTMNEVFFSESDEKLKPAPSKRLNHHKGKTENETKKDRKEVTLLDDDSLWSSPKKSRRF